MQTLLTIIYIAIFIIEIIILIQCFRNKAKWKTLILIELISVIVSTILWLYYNYLPDYGSMPELTYFGEFFISFIFSCVYIIILAITIISRLIVALKKDKSK